MINESLYIISFSFLLSYFFYHTHQGQSSLRPSLIVVDPRLISSCCPICYMGYPVTKWIPRGIGIIVPYEIVSYI